MGEYEVRVFHMRDLHQIILDRNKPVSESFYPGEAYTLYKRSGKKDRVVMCCGLRRILSAVAEAWAIVSPVTKPGPHALKIIHELLVNVTRSRGIKRVFAYVPAHSFRSRKFVRAFGFWDCAIIPGLFYLDDAVVSVWENEEKEGVWQKQLQ